MERKSIYTVDNSGAFQDIDLHKLLSVIKKSVLLVILIVLSTHLAGYLYLRWTKPLYESNSELKLDIKQEASILNLNTFNEPQNLNNISGEIELIKSKLFFNKVLEVVDIKISYFSVGNVLDDERYRHSPFEVSFDFVALPFLDRKFYVEITSQGSYLFSYQEGNETVEREYKFNQTVDSPGFSFNISLNSDFDNQLKGTKYYFVFNSHENLLRYLSDNIKVEPANFNANTIRISFTDFNPFKARDLVNAIDTIYLTYTRLEKTKANLQKIEFLDEQLSVTEERLENYELYFENFTIDNQTTDLDIDLKFTISQIKMLDSQRFNLRKRVIFLQELKVEIDQEKPTYIPLAYQRYLPINIVKDFEQINKLISERDLLLSTQKERTFAVRRKNQEVSIIKEKIDKEVDELIDQLKKDESTYTARKRILENEFVKLPSKSNNFSKNQRRYTLYEEFYLSLMKNKAEFQIAQAGTTTDFKILSSATLPREPISPQKLLIYGIGSVSGFILSFLFVAARYLLHNKISSVKEIERNTQLPVLGTIPYYTLNNDPETKLIVDKKPRSSVSESLRSIRTNIDFMAMGEATKVIGVTSTVSGEGKTFVVTNLGGIIAMGETKVLIIDLDMRKPRIHRALDGDNSSKGVSTILIKKDKIEECIQKSSINNLDFISAGPTPPNPSELLLSKAFDSLIEEVKKIYDIIILDTPPTGLVTDGILALKKSDLPIYVLRADYSNISFLDSVSRVVSLNKFNNLAIVLNSIKTPSAGYGYGYGYHYGYYNDKSIKKTN